MMKGVAIVTVVQHAATTSPAFFSCVGQAMEDGARLVVIDQASTGETIDRIRGTFPHATVIRNPRNTGFASGANQAVRLLLSSSSHAYDTIAFLDTRAMVSTETLRALCRHMRQTPFLGLLGPKWLSLYDEQALDESLHEQVASDRVYSLGLSCTRGMPPLHVGMGTTNVGDEGLRDAEALHAGLVCVNARAMYQLKLDDATSVDPWWVTEDALTDLGWRMRRAGFAVQCDGGAEAHWPCGVFVRPRRRSAFREMQERTERRGRALSVRNAICLFLVHDSVGRILMSLPITMWNLARWSLYLLLFDRASLPALWSWPRHVTWIVRRRRLIGNVSM